ncbi:Arc family DNA-binding protein [Sinorhizobium meliloti]|uniref:Arc family DNA-binding protein n=1 Tax=Rhizobium meliloti TaxID=382 RepID=UPI00129634B3|nr:Arc family DNA-binding protein [Sinorhizobium meliloti]MDW9444811.1 Arc family DNA-binding protein [Sinorhizobium meliloti]MDW9630378.1 Arc family DNA-binding protein [Sinorhizobium meliloti]MQX66300.1 Arc family DNA-binding protein [Sinorhizobium meliloti]
MNNEELERFTLRAPVGLCIELKVMAARARRSFNAQIVKMLEEALASENEKSGTTA